MARTLPVMLKGQLGLLHLPNASVELSMDKKAGLRSVARVRAQSGDRSVQDVTPMPLHGAVLCKKEGSHYVGQKLIDTQLCTGPPRKEKKSDATEPVKVEAGDYAVALLPAAARLTGECNDLRISAKGKKEFVAESRGVTFACRPPPGQQTAVAVSSAGRTCQAKVLQLQVATKEEIPMWLREQERATVAEMYGALVGDFAAAKKRRQVAKSKLKNVQDDAVVDLSTTVQQIAEQASVIEQQQKDKAGDEYSPIPKANTETTTVAVVYAGAMETALGPCWAENSKLPVGEALEWVLSWSTQTVAEYESSGKIPMDDAEPEDFTKYLAFAAGSKFAGDVLLRYLHARKKDAKPKSAQSDALKLRTLGLMVRLFKTSAKRGNLEPTRLRKTGITSWFEKNGMVGTSAQAAFERTFLRHADDDAVVVATDKLLCWIFALGSVIVGRKDKATLSLAALYRDIPSLSDETKQRLVLLGFTVKTKEAQLTAPVVLPEVTVERPRKRAR